MDLREPRNVGDCASLGKCGGIGVSGGECVEMDRWVRDKLMEISS